MRFCFGGHLPILVCEIDEWILVDKIVLAQNWMKYHHAVAHCNDELDGQLWGDIDTSWETVKVISIVFA